MPPPDLGSIATARDGLRAAETALRAGRQAVADAAAALDAARRRGADAAEIRRLGKKVAVAKQRLLRNLEAFRRAEAAINDLLLDPLIDSPDRQLANQSRTLPVALLPVRIETRLRDGKLLIRIYPDQIHLHDHVEAITAAEAEAARGYWRAADADAAREADAWTELAASAGPERARYLADRLRPSSGGEFPAVETVETRPARRPEARLLPARWCASLLTADGRRIARKWSGPVARRLSMSPAGDLLDALDDAPEDGLPLDPEARWLVDFGEALRQGMAIELSPAELAPGARLQDPIARLVVVGADWTLSPEAGAAALAAQLVSHSHSGGFGFVPPGTPTNNSSAAPSGFAAGDRARIGETRPAAAAPAPRADDDLSRLIGALGLGADAFRLAGCSGTARDYEKTVRATHTALWGTCFGFYLGHVLNPLVPDAKLGGVRAHLRDFVRPAGPLPTIRVGRQPYGVLPVLSQPIRRSHAAMPGFGGELANILGRIRAMAEGFGGDGLATDALASIPTLHTDDGRSSAERLADILKLGPLARTARVRPTLGAAAREAASQATHLAEEQHGEIVSLILSSLIGRRVMPWEASLMFGLVVPKTPRYRLDAIPWVAADLDSPDAMRRAIAKMRARIGDATFRQGEIKRLLAVAAGDADTLLEGLLFLSGAFEYWEAGTRVMARHVVTRPDSTLSRTAAAATTRLATAGIVGVEAAAAPAGQIAIETAGQMMTLTGPATDGRHLVAHIGDLLLEPQVPEPVRDVRAFDDALTILAERPAREVDHALRGLLDLGSHRLDAWISSVATRRLAEQRAALPAGLHIGCYGIVHDLTLDAGARDSEGYLHLPSADHAVAAAVLRSGHLANRASDPGAFAIRLTSERVRNALQICEGLAAGQPASALLGYRFERWLIEDRLRAKYVEPLRRLKPHPADARPAGGAAESIPPQDVVDGLALAQAWQEDRGGLLADLQAATGAAVDPALPAFLDALLDLQDAYLDLWVSEATYQMVRGNTARMAAATATLDRQERPPEPQVIQTPRAAWGFAQRVIWALPADAAVAGWPDDIVARAEPVANAMASALIGDPTRFTLAGRPIDAAGVPIAGTAPLAIGLAALGMSPLALLRACKPVAAGSASPLEEAIARRLANAAPLPDRAGIEILGEGMNGAPGVAVLMALLRAARAALFDRRALVPQSLAPPTGLVAETVAPDALAGRAAALRAWLDERIAALETAAAAADPAAIRAAAAEAAVLAPAAGWLLAGVQAPVAELIAEARLVLSTLLAWRRQWDGSAGASDPGEPVEADAARIRILLGADFPLLPPFIPAAALADELRASLEDQDALLGPLGARALRRWRRQMSLVRPQLRALSAALDAARRSEAQPPPARVAQLPHRAGARSALLPFEGEPPREVQLAAVLLGALPGAGAAMAGLLLDEWNEVVPERRTATSVAFHYDAPAARPPQSILLAVDAGVEQGGWTADALVSTVLEGFDLARLRMLRPDQIMGHGAMLPTTFLPRNLSEETLSFDLFGMISQAEQLTATAAILGKEGP